MASFYFDNPSTQTSRKGSRHGEENRFKQVESHQALFFSAWAGTDHGCSGRRSVGHRDLLHRRRANGHGDAVDGIYHLAIHGLRAIHVRPHRHGYRPAEMLTGTNSHIYVVIFGVGIAYATIRFRYHQIAMVMKWLAALLSAYVITAFIAGPDWSKVIRDTFIPSWPRNHNAWENLVAILGTTISPYLFFWQTSQEVEEEKAMGRRLLVQRQGATRKEIVDRKLDVGVGTFFSNFAMYFIILTTAIVLHNNGITKIETSKQAAEALLPFAGTLAYLLYTIGILGVGFLAIPTLAGSAAYAFAETFSWKEGLDEPFRGARPFYAVLIFSILLGIGMDSLNINPVKALFWTAVINGVLAPFLLVGVLIAASDPKLMQGQPSSWLSRIAVGVVTLAMFGAAAAMFLL